MSQTELPDHMIPNLPQCLTDNFTDEFKDLDYQGDPGDITERLRHKIFMIWQLWDRFSKDERLSKVIQNIPSDITTEEFQVKQILLFTYEQIAYILKSSNILEEMLGTDMYNKFKNEATINAEAS